MKGYLKIVIYEDSKHVGIKISAKKGNKTYKFTKFWDGSITDLCILNNLEFEIYTVFEFLLEGMA